MIFLSDYDMLLTEQLVRRRGSLDQHAATALGGLRHQRHEGAGQRRHQSFGTGRLVGGSLRARTWAGRWVMAGNMATIRPGTPPKRRRSTTLLEREVIPEFYTRDAAAFPRAWVARMRESMARLTPRFPPTARSANTPRNTTSGSARLPRAGRRQRRSRRAGREIGGGCWTDKWTALRFGEVKAGDQYGQHRFEVAVYLGDLDPDAVRVERLRRWRHRRSPCGSR